MPTVAFTPDRAGTIKIVASTGSFVTTLAKAANQQLFVQASANSAPAFIEFGSASVTASAANSTPILASQRYTFTVGADVTSVALIGGNTADVVYVTCGQGANPT